MDRIEIRHEYWSHYSHLPDPLLKTLKLAVSEAVKTSPQKLDGAVLRALHAQGLRAKAEQKIIPGRQFKDDIRVYDGKYEISIEIENYGNRLEFDLLKMMAFGSVPYPFRERRKAVGCLIIPANRQLGNPFISGNGRERIWDYVTKRLFPMTRGIMVSGLVNILALGYHDPKLGPGTRKPVRQRASSRNFSTQGQVLADDSLRGRVTDRWVEADKPPWSLNETIEVVIQEDEALERAGHDPAPVFRRCRKSRDNAYLRRWVRGCKFEWTRELY